MSFLHDPDRYRVALLDAFCDVYQSSLREASICIVDEEIERPILSGTRGGTFDISTLRKKHRKSDVPIWRFTMGWCFRIVLTSDPGCQIAKADVLQLAQLVGERAFAERVLWPMIDGRLPDFS